MNSPHSRPLYIDKALPRAAPHRVAYAMCGVPDWFVAAVLAAVALAAALLATRRCGIPSPMGPWYSDMMMPVLRTGRFPGELGPWLVPPCLVPPCCAGCAPAAAYLCCRSRSPGALLRLPLPATTAVPADMVKLHAQHGPLFLVEFPWAPDVDGWDPGGCHKSPFGGGGDSEGRLPHKCAQGECTVADAGFHSALQHIPNHACSITLPCSCWDPGARSTPMAKHTSASSKLATSLLQAAYMMVMASCHACPSVTFRRRLAQPAFTPKAIRGYLPRMQAIAEQAVQKWAAEGDIL